MSDIVERLRSADVLIVKSATDLRSVVAEEAADEIEKLRVALQTVRRDALEEAAQLAKQTAAVLSNPSARDALNYVAATILELGEE